MNVSIVILSHGKTQQLIELTQRTIDSCIASQPDFVFDIIVIEQEPNVVYANCRTFHKADPFNYNGFMNYGISLAQYDYVCLCNNDLVFMQGWAGNIVAAMLANNLLSASPLCPNRQGRDFWKGFNVEFGYNNAQHLSGWCIMIHKKLMKKIGALDDDFPFWFADNAYAEQLKKHGIKHALVRNSVVKHLGSNTLHTLDRQTHDEYTTGQILKFIAKYPDNESAQYFKRRI